jgi:hypothetical protein
MLFVSSYIMVARRLAMYGILATSVDGGRAIIVIDIMTVEIN